MSTVSQKHMVLCWIGVPLLTTLNQACMKMLAGQLGDLPLNTATMRSALHSPWVLGILVSEVLGLVLWLRVLASMPVGRAVPLSAIAYLLVLMLGWFVFDEPMYAAQFIGSGLILAGVWLLSTQPSAGVLV